jgi:hypothetical protein
MEDEIIKQKLAEIDLHGLMTDTEKEIIALYKSATEVSLYKHANYGNEEWDDVLIKMTPEEIMRYEVNKKLMRCKHRIKKNLPLKKNDMFDIMNATARYMQLMGWIDFSEFKD